MTKIVLFIYTFFLYGIDLLLRHWPNAKLKRMYAGRKETQSKVNQFIKKHPHPLWIHCASLGEFEQGRPIIESLKKSKPQIPIVLSFFSPSGYEIRHNDSKADLVVYLPADTPQNARWIKNTVQPVVFVFVKYEFWWNLIYRLVDSPVKTLLVSGVFRKEDYFFKSYFYAFKNLLNKFDRLFIQDSASAEVLKSNGINNYEIAGDTRIDRVIENAQNALLDDKWHQWTGKKSVIIYGSVWDSDMPIVTSSISHFPDCVHIVVPHDVKDSQVRRIKGRIGKKVSLWDDEKFEHNIIIVDTIGWLNKLYKIADFVYIGGGFQKGIHNLLEPASYGLPLFFGPKHKKFTEAFILQRIGQGHPILQFKEMKNIIEKFIGNPVLTHNIKETSKQFFESNKGATARIMTYIESTIDL